MIEITFTLEEIQVLIGALRWAEGESAYGVQGYEPYLFADRVYKKLLLAAGQPEGNL